MTNIKVEGYGGIDIHFLHQKSEVKGAVPLLFVHGWPGNFLEGGRLLPLLKGTWWYGGEGFVLIERRRRWEACL